MGVLRDILSHSFASLTCLVDMPSVLLAPTAWWCHLSGFPTLVVGPFRWPVLRSVILLPEEVIYAQLLAVDFLLATQNFPVSVFVCHFLIAAVE
jgi:hypothetical protein